MLDHLLYEIDRAIFLAGPDWAVLGVIALIILVSLYCVLAAKIERFKQAGFAVINLLILTYKPCVCFPGILETVYMRLGLITKAYLEMPFVLRFPTLWVPAILIPVGLWTVMALFSDWFHRRPITTKAIYRKSWENAAKAKEQFMQDIKPGQYN